MTKSDSREARSFEPDPGGDRPVEFLLRRQREWLLEHFPADRVVVKYIVPPFLNLVGRDVSDTVPIDFLDAYLRSRELEGCRKITTHSACRCWCCGKLLGERALFVSKVDPNGTTRRSNIRPACTDHAA